MGAVSAHDGSPASDLHVRALCHDCLSWTAAQQPPYAIPVSCEERCFAPANGWSCLISCKLCLKQNCSAVHCIAGRPRLGWGSLQRPCWMPMPHSAAPLSDQPGRRKPVPLLPLYHHQGLSKGLQAGADTSPDAGGQLDQSLWLAHRPKPALCQ